MNKEEVVIICAFVGLHLFNTLMHGMEKEMNKYGLLNIKHNHMASRERSAVQVDITYCSNGK
jgi:hypothetical protein